MAAQRGSTTASSIKRGQHPRTQDHFQEDFGVASGDGVVASELKSKSKWCRLKLKSSSSQLHRQRDRETDRRKETLARVAHLTHAINWLELLCRCGSHGGGGSVSVPPACPATAAAVATAGPPGCLAVIVVLINELDGSLRNQLVCSLAFVSSRLAIQDLLLHLSLDFILVSWRLYRVSCILYLVAASRQYLLYDCLLY